MSGTLSSPSSYIKPIETAYKGYRFRSRLEARWAVFFDALDIRYDYESEGFDLGSDGWYLPDFYLPDIDCFFEVKPRLPTQKEWEKCHGLQTTIRKTVFISTRSPIDIPRTIKDGIPVSYPNEIWSIPSIIFGSEFQPEWGDNFFDDPYQWSKCSRCGCVGITFFGDMQDLPCSCFPHGRYGNFGSDNPDLIKAFTRARSARFEFGEQS